MRPFTKKGNKKAPAEKSGKKSNSKGKSRKLQDTHDDDQMWGAYDPSAHKIRHQKKMRKHNERLSDKRRHEEADFMSRNDPYRATAVNMSRNSHEVGSPSNHSLALANLDPRFANHTDGIIKEQIGTHNYCYTAGEVLEIIAMTCLVNFLFWFAIITCVSVASRRERARYNKWASADSVEIISEEEFRLHDSNHYPCCLRRTISPAFDYPEEGFGHDYNSTEEEDPLVRQIDGRYSFSRNSCFEDDSQDWGILYPENSEVTYWRERSRSRSRSPDSITYSVENLLI